MTDLITKGVSDSFMSTFFAKMVNKEFYLDIHIRIEGAVTLETKM